MYVKGCLHPTLDEKLAAGRMVIQIRWPCLPWVQVVFMRTYYVYIVSNKLRTTFYTGVTNNIERRMFEHRFSLIEGFSKHYRLKFLVYYEEFGDITDAIAREKQLKRWHRGWKLALMRKINPDLRDLAEDWFEGRL